VWIGSKQVRQLTYGERDEHRSMVAGRQRFVFNRERIKTNFSITMFSRAAGTKSAADCTEFKRIRTALVPDGSTLFIAAPATRWTPRNDHGGYTCWVMNADGSERRDIGECSTSSGAPTMGDRMAIGLFHGAGRAAVSIWCACRFGRKPEYTCTIPAREWLVDWQGDALAYSFNGERDMDEL